MHLYCSRYLKNINRFYWRQMGLCYGNPSFSQLTTVVTINALEGARVVLCTPESVSIYIFRGAPQYPNLWAEADFTYKNPTQVIFAQNSRRLVEGTTPRHM